MRYPRNQKRQVQTTGPRLQVIHLSEISLTKAQEELLELDLNFAPTAQFLHGCEGLEFVCTEISI